MSGERQPWQERLIAESMQVDERLKALDSFINGEGFDALTERDKSLLRSQRYYMRGYSETLRERLGTFETADT